MLKHRYSLLCVFLCLCLLFPLFSFSVNAVTVDGYNITNAWWYDNPQDYLIFTNQIVSPSDFNYITIQVDIDLINSIKAKSVFDINLAFSSSQHGIISVTKFQPLNSSQVALDTLYPSVVNNNIVITDLQYKEDVKYIRVQFLIERPTWSVKNVEGNITIAGKTYKYQKNMTWGEWCDSSYDTIGLYVDNGKVYGANVKLVYDGVTVNANDYIMENGVYFLEPLGSVATTISFYVNDDKYSCDANMTWLDFINSDYNIDNRFSTSSWDDDDYGDWVEVVTYDGYMIGEDLWLAQRPDEQIIHGSKYYTVDFYNSTYALVNYYFDFSLTSVSVDIQDEQGILNTIIKYFRDTLNRINDLPSKIGEILFNKIQGLFVPNQDKIIEIGDKFEALLKNRFGAAYEAYEVVDNFASAFVFTEAKESIFIPSVTVNLAGTDFIFGGWTVYLVPDGFEGVVDSLKLVGNIVCTVAFLNGVRKRYSEVIHDAR